VRGQRHSPAALYLEKLGELGRGSFIGTFERQMGGSGNRASLNNFIFVPVLNPDYVRSLNLGAIWKCCEGPEPL